MNHQNFRQHFAVHELEAWLLSSREIFPVAVQTALPNRPPEEVNFDEHPARLLAKLYKQRVKSNYNKIIDGSDLFTGLSPETAYTKCPHLKLMLDEMLELAKNALA